jgi:hypothetical protein
MEVPSTDSQPAPAAQPQSHDQVVKQAPNVPTDPVAEVPRSPALRKRRSLFRFFWPNAAVGLDLTEEEYHQYMTALRKLQNDASAWELNAWMHHDLTVLDDKTNSIVQVNAVAIAVMAIIIQSEPQMPRTPFVLLFGAMVLLIWSIIPLLGVMYVYWSSREQILNPDGMLVELMQVRNRRSMVVRRSVIKIVYAMILFLLSFVILYTKAPVEAWFEKFRGLLWSVF